MLRRARPLPSAIAALFAIALLAPMMASPFRAAAATTPCRAGGDVTLADLLATVGDYAGPVTLEYGEAMGPMLISDLALECYGDRTLRFSAYVRDPGVVGWESPFGLRPRWFQGVGLFVASAEEPPPGRAPLVALALPPVLGDVQARHEGHWVTVTGHFDDPAAATCTALGPPEVTPSTAEAVTICRSTFVVTGVSRAAAPATSTEGRPAPEIEPWRVAGWLLLSAALGSILVLWLAERRRI